MFFKICPSTVSFKNVANFTGKHLCGQGLFLIQLKVRQGQAVIHLLIPELLPLFISIFLFLMLFEVVWSTDNIKLELKRDITLMTLLMNRLTCYRGK